MIFHANGVGGPAMEELAADGVLGGRHRLHAAELANALVDGFHVGGPERLRVAGRHGLPQVVVPGCIDFFNQGAPDTVPERFRDAQELHPQPRVHARADSDGRGASSSGGSSPSASNEATGPVRVMVPTRGFSLADVPGGAFWDPAADPAFLDALRDALRADIPFEAVDAHVNDPEFADRRRRALPAPSSRSPPMPDDGRPDLATTCSTSRRRTSPGSRSART